MVKTQNKEKAESQGTAPDPTQSLAAAIAIFDDEFEKLNLFGKISAISGYLGRIPKNGYNKFNSYSYVLESDLVEHVRYWLAAARILIYQSVESHTVYTFDGVENKGRQRDVLTDVVYEFVVTDGRTGETFSFTQIGQGSDPRDKGANKASTSAMKFAYMRLFNISSGEDSEADEKGDANHGKIDAGVSVTSGTVDPATVQRGGKLTTASQEQIKAISNLSNQLSLGAVGLVGVIKKVLDVAIDLDNDETKHAQQLAKFLKEQAGEDAGKLIYTLQEMAKALPGDESGPGY